MAKSVDNPAFFSGPERVEGGAPFGRPTRKGTFEELAVSDIQRVRDSLRQERADLCKEYLGILFPTYSYMLTTSLEWCLGYPNALLHHLDSQKVEEISGEVYERWRAASDAWNPGCEAVRFVQGLLSPTSFNANTVVEFREKMKAGQAHELAAELLAQPNQIYQELESALERQDFSRCTSIAEKYFSSVRDRHDLLLQYTWMYGAVLAEKDQALAEKVMHGAFSSCLIYPVCGR